MDKDMQFQRHVSHAREKQKQKQNKNSLCKRARSRPPTASASPEPSSRPPPPQAYSPWPVQPQHKTGASPSAPSKIKSLAPRKTAQIPAHTHASHCSSCSPGGSPQQQQHANPVLKTTADLAPSTSTRALLHVPRAPLYPATKNSNRPKTNGLTTRNKLAAKARLRIQCHGQDDKSCIKSTESPQQENKSTQNTKRRRRLQANSE